eukprot:1350977-Rhodomonas_salina.3
MRPFRAKRRASRRAGGSSSGKVLCSYAFLAYAPTLFLTMLLRFSCLCSYTLLPMLLGFVVVPPSLPMLNP